MIRQITKRVAVSETFTYLGAVNLEKVCMKPVVRKRLAGRGFGLRDLVGMVYGDMIDATRMDIDSLS